MYLSPPTSHSLLSFPLFLFSWGFGSDPLLAASQEGSSNDLGEVMQGMSGEECTSVWSGLKNILPSTLADATPVSGPSHDA